MKNLTFMLVFICLCGSTFGQVSGDISRDKRKIVKSIDYSISYSKKGNLVFNIVVNQDGAVQSCVLDKSSSSIVSTPAMMKAKNKILHGLKFAKGYDYPRFHRGHVEINTVQETGSVDDSFSPPSKY